MESKRKLKLSRIILLLAAVYNMGWGIVTAIYPHWLLFGNEGLPFTLILIRCIAMLVAVYGIAYYFSSLNPARYWPLIFTGLVGKILGPIGSVYYVMQGHLPQGFLIVNVFNDLIWIVPFYWILIQVHKRHITQ